MAFEKMSFREISKLIRASKDHRFYLSIRDREGQFRTYVQVSRKALREYLRYVGYSLKVTEFDIKMIGKGIFID